MMKKKELIELVIQEQRKLKSDRSMRMYQIFKLIRRELLEELKQEGPEIKDRSC
jgi:hypothetical protein